MYKTLIVSALILVFGAAVFSQTPKSLPDLKPDEIIARHLASIGSPEAISAVKSRVFVGQARLTSRIGYIGQLTGQAQFASAGNNLLLAAIFNSNEYPYEKAAFNGKDVSVGRPNGNLTPFGDFLKANKGIIREGLFGGVLSTAWPLLSKEGKLKFTSAGIAEIGGRSFYKLKVTGGSLGGTKVVMFFDGENFRHAATEYTQTISVGISKGNKPAPESDDFGTNTGTAMANTKETYMTFTERFSNYAKSGDTVIPLTYVIDYTYQDKNGVTTTLNLDVRFKDVYLNQDLGADVFNVS